MTDRAMRFLRRVLPLLSVLTISFPGRPLFAQANPAPGDPDQPAVSPSPGGTPIRQKIDENEYLRLREEHIARLRGIEPGKPFDPNARTRAIKQLENQESLLVATKVHSGRFGIVALDLFPLWTELGPNPIPNGPTTPTSAVSGRVTAIEIDPFDSNKVYVGAAQGGVFRSLDGGTTWRPIFDGAQSLAIGALALDAANGRLYVGTGEANASGDSYSGAGLYRIDNVNGAATLAGPINPTRIYNDGNNLPTSSPVFTGRSISKILIVPNDPTTLFVGTAGGGIGLGNDAPFGGTLPPLGLRGLYRLTAVTGPPASAGVTRIGISTTGPGGCFDTPCTGNRNVNDIVFDPGDATGNTLIAWQNGTSTVGDGGIWRSTNAMSGTPTFTQSLITTASTSGNGRGSLAIYKQGTSPAVVYAASGEPSSGTSCIRVTSGAMRVSTDGGVTFGAKLSGSGGFCDGQCFYNIGLAVNPGPSTAQGDDIIYLGGNVASVDNCERLAAKSTDGGATFSDTGGPHADTHAIRIAPSNSSIIYRGDDGGIWKSTNAGATWSSLNNATFRATQFQSLALHPTDPNFSIGGTQDNGTNQLLPTSLWNRIDFGDGGFAAIDQNAADTSNVVMYHTYFNQTNRIIGYASVDTVAAATDNNWPFYGCDVSSFNGITCTDAVLFYAPLVLGPGNPNTVYFGSDRLYRSTNKGVNNVIVSQVPIVTQIPISAIAVSPQDDNYRIVGLANGALYFTTTGSTTLTLLDATGGGGLIPDKYVARIVFDPADKNTAYVAVGGYMGSVIASNAHVWKITNLSTTPVKSAINGSGSTGLPDVPVNAFAVDPAKTTRLFAGTDIGVYDSEDGGATWSPFGLGLPRVAVFDMGVQNVKRVLRIATHGRGLWEIGVPGAGTTIVNPPSNVTATATGTLTLQVTWSAAGTATSYQVWRSSNNSPYVPVGTTNGTTFNDTVLVLTPTTYLYKVKSVDASVNVSPFSVLDYATTAVFTSDPLIPGTTTPTAVHLSELRVAVDAMRASIGQLPFSYAGPGPLIQAVHITDLRTNLNFVRSTLGLPVLAFTNPLLTPGTTVVRAIDFQEIRAGVK